MADPTVAAIEKWRAFLQATPAYVDEKITGLLVDLTPQNPTAIHGIRPIRIQLFCEKDDGVRWFDCASGNVNAETYQTAFVRYVCRDCGLWAKTVALIVQPIETHTSVTVMKLGEYPPFGSHLAKRLRDLLSEADLELYRKGLRTEREGHGIGAAAYFRRVVDNQWKALVLKLREAAAKLGTSPEGLQVFDDALAQTQFSQAVEMLKDAIPAKLLILDGQNPLTLLYKPLSVQIHNLTDAECLQQAADIRIVLNELFDNISRVLKDDEHLKGAVARLQG